MCDLRADIDRESARGDIIHVLREALPSPPFDPLIERGSGDVLHPLHQLDQFLFLPGTHRCKADAAIAHNHGGDAVVRGGREFIVPADLTVIMRVDVDPARGDDVSLGIDLAARRAGNLRGHLGDHPVLERHVANERLAARAIDDPAATNDHVMHQDFLSGFFAAGYGSLQRRAPSKNAQHTTCLPFTT